MIKPCTVGCDLLLFSVYMYHVKCPKILLWGGGGGGGGGGAGIHQTLLTGQKKKFSA